MVLTLKLLDEFAVRDRSGAALSLPTRKTRALLGYLAVNADKPQPRERLMALLWSDRGERQARQSLNQALMALHKLGDGDGAAMLDSDGERVTLRGEAVDCDVARLRSLAKDAPAEAAGLYDGPFLDGLSIPDPAFEDWLSATRAELHALACDALATAAATSDDAKTALACARRLVALDPLREDAHRRLMELLHESGDRAAALRQYRACADILKRELQVEPDAATKALFEKIRHDNATAVTSTSSLTQDLPPFPDKPSIAVLPFVNLSGDETADQFADGLTEDLITALAQVRDMFVIARHSTAIYKGQTVNVQNVAKAFGVRYVLEGSIRTDGGRIRCSVQLIEAVRSHHLWAQRYDRPYEDIFHLQDEIVRRILIELRVKLMEGDSARLYGRGTNNLDAWLFWVQGHAELVNVTLERAMRARPLFEAACKSDPNWARPFAELATTYYYEARLGPNETRENAIARAKAYAERAVEIDPEDPQGYLAVRNVHVLLRSHDKALALCERAVSLAPNDYVALAMHAMSLLMSADDPTKAVAVMERAVRLGPNPPTWVQRSHGLTLHVAGRIDRAISVFEELVRHAPDFLDGYAQLAAAHASAGHLEAARATVAKIHEKDPTYCVTRSLARVYFRNEERTKWLRDLLIKAGLPDGDATEPHR